MEKIILAYVPVLHQGYRELFEKQKDADQVWILGDSFAKKFKEIRKDVRRLDPELVAKAIKSWNLFDKVEVVTAPDLEKMRNKLVNKSGDQTVEIICPNDEVLKQIVGEYLDGVKVKYEPIFLRWDKHNAIKEKKIDKNDNAMSFDDFNQKIMKQAFVAAEHSSDWWRHIGAVIVRDGEVVLVGYNKHLPTEHAPYFYNDVRSLFSKGKYFELVSSIHAEAMIIAEAAKKGIPLKSTDMYVTTFPCPVCAKQIAQAGIKRLFYSGDYSMLDGETILKSADVELIKVNMSDDDQQHIKELEAEKSIVKKYE